MESDNDCLECAQDIKKVVEKYKDIESYFYPSDASNDNLESKF